MRRPGRALTLLLLLGTVVGAFASYALATVTLSSTATTITAKGLKPCSQYRVRLQRRQPDGSFSTTSTFYRRTTCPTTAPPNTTLTPGTCATSFHTPLAFPTGAGAPGAGLPNVDYSAELAGFTRIDSMNYGAGRSARATWAADPYGTGAGTVSRHEVRLGDSSRYLGQRADLFIDRAPQNGKEAWYFAKYGLDLAGTPSWAVVFQLYGGSGSPPVAIDVSGGNLVLATEFPTFQARTLVAGIPEGRWQYTVLHVVQCESSNGLVEAWHGDGAPPSLSAAPLHRVSGIQTDNAGADGFPEVGLYRSASSDPAQYPSVVYWAHWERKATSAPPAVGW